MMVRECTPFGLLTQGRNMRGEASSGENPNHRFAYYELKHVGTLGAESHSDSDLVRPARLTSAAGGAIVTPGGRRGQACPLLSTRPGTRPNVAVS